jgi:cytochrome c biogenesis protein CcmG, thiol:disulfide interchange protein DsbE
MMRYLLPAGVFAALVALLGVGLTLNPREVPSPLVGKPAPHFELPQLHDAGATFSQREMLGSVWLLNVWASWCPPCLEEHPYITTLARSGRVPVIGLNYKDKPQAARAWLARHGDPYRVSASDIEGRIAIDYGVYGVPETYVIDRDGIIRYKRVGPVTPQILEKRIMPLIEELQRR